MEFHIKLAGAVPGARPDPAHVERLLQDIDPAALGDVDASGQTLRLSAALDRAQLLEVLHRAGWALAPEDVYQVPSVCCGGCSG